MLEPGSIVKVAAAAKAGDIRAQSALGTAYLRGGPYLAKNLTQAVYWLHKVADRDPAEFDRIHRRMRYVLEERRHESDPQSQRMLDREYLSLVERKLAYEQALLGLAQVYAGGQGASHANPQLALKYLRLGAAYGFPSSQRVLGLVILSGSLGARRSELEGRRWLYAAAAKGDRVAVRWLTELDKSSAANRMGEPFPRS